MKQKLTGLMIAIFFMPGMLAAQTVHSIDNARLAATLSAKSAQETDAFLSKPDAHGTPLVLQLARRGDIKTLQNLGAQASTGNFIQATDTYGNNLFHVAKNADTIQVISSLIRRFYGAKATRVIGKLANTRNKLNETPLHAQINAAHTDTFRPLYTYTILKKKNDVARSQLDRLQGADERIYAQHKAIYCRDIVAAGSANGVTLLQAAQAQIPYNPQMAQMAGTIGRILPCLAQN